MPKLTDHRFHDEIWGDEQHLNSLTGRTRSMMPAANREPDIPSYSRGLANVVADETSVSQVQGEVGKLIYRGIPVETIALRSNFEEVAFFLLRGRLPSANELAGITETMQNTRTLPREVVILLASLPSRTPAMVALQAAVSTLAIKYPPIPIKNSEENLLQAVSLISALSTCVATISRYRRNLSPVEPRSDLSHVENFLYMMQGRVAEPGDIRLFETASILHMDHDFNASTFTARVIASTEAGLVSSVAGAVGALSGPLHGGANERVMMVVEGLSGPESARQWVKETLAKKGKVPGFGHRVYRTVDPRSVVLRDLLERLVGKSGQRREYDILVAIHDAMIEAMGGKQKDYVRENVDFWSGALYKCMGFESPDFTPIFAFARVVGWCAHILELWSDNRIYRPSAHYVGPSNATYTRIDQR